ncbi:MAG: cytochrome c [Saprospiraceae bacterium]
MKNISLIFVAILFLMTACADSPEKKQTKKPSDKPDYSKVQPKVKTENKKPVSNREPSSPKQLAKAEAILASVSEADIATVNGKQIYKNYCGICHGITGDLNVNGATDLTKSELPMNERVAQVYHGRGLMTPFKGLLKGKEIVAVTQYIEDLRK